MAEEATTVTEETPAETPKKKTRVRVAKKTKDESTKEPKKRGPGRPKGSKNKKRGPGRPKAAKKLTKKRKPRTVKPTMSVITKINTPEELIAEIQTLDKRRDAVIKSGHNVIQNIVTQLTATQDARHEKKLISQLRQIKTLIS